MYSEEKNTYGTSGTLEQGNLVTSGLPVLLGDNGLEDVAGNVPELLVLGAEQDDDADGLGVEGGRDVQGGLLDDLGDALLGDGQVLGQDVVGAAVLDQLNDRVGRDDGGRHVGFGCVVERSGGK